MHNDTKIGAGSLIVLLVTVLCLEYADKGYAAPSDAYFIAKAGQGNQGGGNGGNSGGGNGGGNTGGGNSGGHNGGGQGNSGGGNSSGNSGGNGNGGNNSGGNNGGGNGGGDSGGGNSGNIAGNAGGQGGGRGAGVAGVRGRQIPQHAAALHFIFRQHQLHLGTEHWYTFHHQNVRPATFASQEIQETWNRNVHAACCSIFRYLQRLRELHPTLKPDYVDWITGQVADALQEDRDEVKAALLGYPHNHAHVSPVLAGITKAGCAATGTVAAIRNERFAEQHGMHGDQASVAPFTIQDVSTPTNVAFRILDGGSVLHTYGLSHTKEMHLIIVREDLRHFAHLHPERDAEGTWRVPYVPPAGGTYWLYADFVTASMDHHTIRFEKTYSGDAGAEGVVRDARTQKPVKDITVRLQEIAYSGGTLFTFYIEDERGKALFIEPYLGAMGHSILISPEGDFIHTHPSPASDHITFHVADPRGTFYRIFTQFKVHGHVRTVEFDWEPRQSEE